MLKTITILLTGCIHPNTKDALVINDADVRKKQYMDAIHWYLVNTPYNIVFCENSGTDISGEIGTGGAELNFSPIQANH